MEECVGGWVRICLCVSMHACVLCVGGGGGGEVSLLLLFTKLMMLILIIYNAVPFTYTLTCCINYGLILLHLCTLFYCDLITFLIVPSIVNTSDLLWKSDSQLLKRNLQTCFLIVNLHCLWVITYSGDFFFSVKARQSVICQVCVFYFLMPVYVHVCVFTLPYTQHIAADFLKLLSFSLGL